MNQRPNFDSLHSKVSFRFAVEADLPELMNLYRLFYEEAVYKDYLDFDTERATNTIRIGIITNSRPHILAFVDTKMAGFIAWVLDHSFSTKPCQIMAELYVLPEFRRSALGRHLVGFSILEGRNAGAGAYHAPVASGLKETRSLFNLFGKAGFQQFGFMMRRKL